MIAAEFSEVVGEIAIWTGFSVAMSIAAIVLLIACYLLGGWDDYATHPARQIGSTVFGVLVAVPVTAFFVVWGAALADDGDAPTTFSHDDGLGPDTVCWYALAEDDEVISAKPYIVEEGVKTVTVCNLTPEAIPDEIKTGDQ